MSVLVVGSASRDLSVEDLRGWRLGGAVAYGALALARLGLDVRALVGVDSEASSAAELDLLRDAGADVRLAPLGRAPVFINDERPSGREQVALEVADPISLHALPPGWAATDAVLLAPIAHELGDEWADVGRADVGRAGRAPVAIGWQGLLRTLVAGELVRRSPPAPSALVGRAQLVGLSRADVAPDVPVAALVALLGPAATLVITDGERGGMTGIVGRPSVDPAVAAPPPRWRTYPAIPADRVVDATGAGDVFLAALFAARLDRARLGGPQASRGGDLRLAAAAASLTVEAPGLAGVPTLDAVLRRAERARSA